MHFCQYQASSVALGWPGVNIMQFHVFRYMYICTCVAILVSTCLVIIISTVEVMSGFCFCMSFQSNHTNSLSSWKRHSIQCSYTQLVPNQWACITSHTMLWAVLSCAHALCMNAEIFALTLHCESSSRSLQFSSARLRLLRSFICSMIWLWQWRALFFE